MVRHNHNQFSSDVLFEANGKDLRLKSCVAVNLLTLGGASVIMVLIYGNYKVPGVYDTQMLVSTYFEILVYITDSIRVASLLLNISILKLETKN